MTQAVVEMGIAGIAVGALLLAMLVGLWRARSVLTAADVALPTSVAMAAWLAVVPVPRGPWHTNYHGYDHRIIGADDLSWSPRQLAGLHGPGVDATLEILRELTFHTVGLYTLQAFVSGMGPALLALLVARRSDRVAGLVAGLALAWWPVHLRLAPTDVDFIVAEALLLGAVWTTDRAATAPTVERLVLAGLAVFAASWSRAELVVVAPVVAAAWAVGVGRRDAWSSRRVWIAAACVVTAVAVGVLWRAGAVARGVAIAAGGVGRDVSDMAPTLALAMLAAVLCVLSAVATRVHRRDSRRLLGVAGVVAIGATVWWMPTGLGAQHPVFVADLTGRPWQILAVGGAIALLVARPREAAMAAVVSCVCLVPHAGNADSFTSFTRTALLWAWVPAWWVGEAVAAWGRWSRFPGMAVAGAVVLAVGLATRPDWVWTPLAVQQEVVVVDAARTAAQAGERVLLLTNGDTPEVPDRAAYFADRRQLVQTWVHTPDIHLVDERSLACLREEEDASGALFLQTLECFRIPQRADMGKGLLGPHVVEPTWGLTTPRASAARFQVRALSALFPCWDAVQDAPCVDAACTVRRCPSDAVPTPGWMEPACRWVHDHYELEAVERVVPDGLRGFGAHADFAGASAEVALFRLVRRRTPAQTSVGPPPAPAPCPTPQEPPDE